MEAKSVWDADGWRASANRIFGPISCRPYDAEFSAWATQREFSPDLRVSRIETGAQLLDRPAALIDAGQAQELLVLMQLNGQSTLIQRGRAVSIGEGAVAICEGDVPFRFELPTPQQSLIVLQLSRSLAGLPAHMVSQASAHRIGADVPGQVALRGLVYGLQSPQLALSAGAGVGVGAALARAAAEVFSAVVRGLLAQRGPEVGERLKRLAALRSSLREQLADPELTVEQLAAQHFLSPRQVHALFAEEADTPAAFLRRTRLQHAERLLLQRDETGMTVAAISRESGYSDSAAFIRAFTRERGRSPVRWAESRRGGSGFREAGER